MVVDLEEVERKNILIGHAVDQQTGIAALPKNITTFIPGYPLLVELYRVLEKGAWLGNPIAWPTKGTNILALRLASGKIIRLHISTIATGCYLYATYSKDLEERINLWQALQKKDAIKLAVEYALEWNRLKTEGELAEQKRIEDAASGLPEHFEV